MNQRKVSSPTFLSMIVPEKSCILRHYHYCGEETIICININSQRLPWWLRGKEATWQCWRHGFDPWVRKVPWRRKGQLTQILVWEIPRSEEEEGLSSMGSQKSWTWLSDLAATINFQKEKKKQFVKIKMWGFFCIPTVHIFKYFMLLYI